MPARPDSEAVAEAVFTALADPSRRAILAALAAGGPATATDLATRLLAHYDVYKRNLPWRATSDPYRIWISEVMLQQTRVETVVPYYNRWIERFPTVHQLADAPLDDVLKQWEGLGYYSRARNLHRAALVVREQHAGSLPRASGELRELPGFGEYTAGAVASIALLSPGIGRKA